MKKKQTAKKAVPEWILAKENIVRENRKKNKTRNGIIYLQMKKDSPRTTYIQPWNNERDESVLYSPEVKQGDIMIVPQFLTHYTEPNTTYLKKRILSFDFHLETGLI